METSNSIEQTRSVMVKMVTDAWLAQNDRIDKLVGSLTDEQIAARTAPGRNTGTYIFGHLIAVSDRIVEALGWGGRSYPELDEPFLFKPDGSDLPRPSVSQLREYWTNVNKTISAGMATMRPADWFTRHSTVSAEDFEKEPHRNKLNILLSRSIHTSNHLGQLTYLKEKQEG